MREGVKRAPETSPEYLPTTGTFFEQRASVKSAMTMMGKINLLSKGR